LAAFKATQSKAKQATKFDARQNSHINIIQCNRFLFSTAKETCYIHVNGCKNKTVPKFLFVIQPFLSCNNDARSKFVTFCYQTLYPQFHGDLLVGLMGPHQHRFQI
jgi:hypothetical protein